MDMGTAVLVGRLSRDPQFFGEGDKQRAVFSIAFNRGRDDKRKANFIDCIAWGKRADIMRDFSKGKGIFITGDLEQDTYVNKDDVKVSRVQVNVSSITATTSTRRPDSESNGEGGATTKAATGAAAGAAAGAATGVEPSVEIPF